MFIATTFIVSAGLIVYNIYDYPQFNFLNFFWQLQPNQASQICCFATYNDHRKPTSRLLCSLNIPKVSASLTKCPLVTRDQAAYRDIETGRQTRREELNIYFQFE